jgi:hypothetical protein
VGILQRGLRGGQPAARVSQLPDRFAAPRQPRRTPVRAWQRQTLWRPGLPIITAGLRALPESRADYAP